MQLITTEAMATILGVRPARARDLARDPHILHAGTVVKIGRQVRINEDKLREFIEAGGCALPGGWRREA